MAQPYNVHNKIQDFCNFFTLVGFFTTKGLKKASGSLSMDQFGEILVIYDASQTFNWGCKLATILVAKSFVWMQEVAGQEGLTMFL